MMGITEACRILGVSYGTNQEGIIKAYRKLALKYHPDRNRGNEKWAKQEFIKVGEAYSVLSNPFSKNKPQFSNNSSSDKDKFKEAEDLLNKMKRERAEKDRRDAEALKKKQTEREKNQGIQEVEQCFAQSGVSASDLDPSLWAPYSDWRDKLEEIIKNTGGYCAKAFCFLSDIKIEINRAKWKKIDSKLFEQSDRENRTYNDYSQKDSGKKENFNKNQKGYSENDNFGDKKDGKDRRNDDKKYFSEYIKELEDKIKLYKKEQLETSSNEKREYYQESIATLEKELEVLKKKLNSNNEQDADKENIPDLSDYRTQAQSVIQNALDKDPKINDSDLGSGFQNWKNKLTGLDNQTAIADFQANLLLHIKKIRETKEEEQKNTENVNKINDPNATDEEKKRALKDIEKNEGQQSYEKDRDKIKKAKKEMAKKNATEYRNKVIAELPAKLTKYGVEENELDDQTQQEIKQLKNGEITAPEKVVETEIKITQKIGEKGAEKKITHFSQELEIVLKTKDEAKKANLKMSLMEFIVSNNIYYQVKRAQAEAFLNRLQNPQEQNNSPASNFPYGIVIPLSLLGLLLIGLLVIALRKKKKKNFKKY